MNTKKSDLLSFAEEEKRSGQEYGRFGILAFRLRRVFYALYRSWFRLLQYAYRILSEGRSFLGHIETRNSKNFAVDLGPGFQMSPNGHLEDCIRTRYRIRDMQEMVSNRPWASLVDLQIDLEGWDKGAESVARHIHNSGSCSVLQDTSTS